MSDNAIIPRHMCVSLIIQLLEHESLSQLIVCFTNKTYCYLLIGGSECIHLMTTPTCIW